MRKLLPILALFAVASVGFAADTASNETKVKAPTEGSVFALSPTADVVKISLEAKGVPMRSVLSDAFDAAKLQYVIDPTLDATVYISIKETPLPTALALLFKLQPFEVRSENGVFHIFRRNNGVKTPEIKRPVAPKADQGMVPMNPLSDGTGTVVSGQLVGEISPQNFRATFPQGKLAAPTTQTIVAKPIAKTPTKTPIKAAAKPALKTTTNGVAKATQSKVAPKATVAKTPITKPVVKENSETKTAAQAIAMTAGAPVLNEIAVMNSSRITTKFAKTDMRDVFAEFGRQAEIRIVVAEDVPHYKVDAYMNKTSLKYALDRICRAAKLQYKFVNGEIRITAGA